MSMYNEKVIFDPLNNLNKASYGASVDLYEIL